LRTGRFASGGFGFSLDITPTVLRLLIATFAVWLVQVGFGWAHSRLFEDLFALDPQHVFPWRPWQLFTYMFLHSAPGLGAGFSPLHILMNMLMLVMFGGAVERRMGARHFLRYYLICGAAGGLLALLPPFRDATVVGASGAVLGVLTAFGLFYPDAPVLLLFIPVPAKVLVIFLALLNLFSAAGAQGGISYIAHVGGMAAGYLMIRGAPFAGRLSRRWEERERDRRAERRAHLLQRRDEILDKINREGRDSLSQEEWRILLEESKRLRNN
jgi:membrane associated rhomboid family serine protease